MTRNIRIGDARLIADAVDDVAQRAVYWKSRAQLAEDGLSLIREMLRSHGGKPTIEGDAFKIADATLPDHPPPRQSRCS